MIHTTTWNFYATDTERSTRRRAIEPVVQRTGGIWALLHPADVIPFNSSQTCRNGCADMPPSTSAQGQWKHDTNPSGDPTILAGPRRSVPFIQRKGCSHQGLPAAAAQPKPRVAPETQQGQTERSSATAGAATLCWSNTQHSSCCCLPPKFRTAVLSR